MTRRGHGTLHRHAPSVAQGERRLPEQISAETREVVEWARLDALARREEVSRLIEGVNRGEVIGQWQPERQPSHQWWRAWEAEAIRKHEQDEK